jgi:hypothetical protein
LSGGDWILTPKHSVSHHRGGGKEGKKKAAGLSPVGLYLGWDLYILFIYLFIFLNLCMGCRMWGSI